MAVEAAGWSCSGGGGCNKRVAGDSPAGRSRQKRSRSNESAPPEVSYFLGIVSSSLDSKDVAAAAAALAHRFRFSNEEREVAIHGGIVQCAVARLAHPSCTPEVAINCLKVLQACMEAPGVPAFLAQNTHVLRALLASMQARCSPEIRTLSSQLLSKLEPDWWKRTIVNSWGTGSPCAPHPTDGLMDENMKKLRSEIAMQMC